MWGKRDDTIVHGESPFNAELTRSALGRGALTAIDTFYSRNHGPIPVDILTPEPGTTVSAGQLTVAGYAFAGDDRSVARVDVSDDGGITWQQASLEPELSRWSWRRWSAAVDTEPGPLTVTARAWDSTGAMQPESAAALWNPKGYANNSWARTRVHVA